MKPRVRRSIQVWISQQPIGKISNRQDKSAELFPVRIPRGCLRLGRGHLHHEAPGASFYSILNKSAIDRMSQQPTGSVSNRQVKSATDRISQQNFFPLESHAGAFALDEATFIMKPRMRLYIQL